MILDAVAAHFGLGTPEAVASVIPGGLSNELWRLETDAGVFAVKRMRTNADRAEFAANVQASYAVEARCHAAGIPMAAPVPGPDGQALGRVGTAFYRVHEWVDGTTGDGSADEAIALLAGIHAASSQRWVDESADYWKATGWPDEVQDLARIVTGGPTRLIEVDSHRDLDRKNVLRRADGVLAAVDWDAAGAIPVVQDAVGVALDWAGEDLDAFRPAIDHYEELTGTAIPAEPWIFGAWVAAQGGWLEHCAAIGNNPEAAKTLTRLSNLAVNLDRLCD